MIYAPTRMRPCYKRTLWGGTCLKKEFGKTDAPEITAESWELASHPDGSSKVAEVQQSSNATFRIYDFGRRGPNGQPRLLHLERAAEVLSYEPIVPQDCKANSAVCFPEFTMAEMFSCRYFRACRLDVRRSAELCCHGGSFQYVLCVEGGGIIRSEPGADPFALGDSYFMPAALGAYQIEGRRRVLLSRI